MSVPSQVLPGWLGHWQPRLDAIGAIASTLCAAHCVLLPLAVALMPLAGWQSLESTAFDIGFVVFATLFGAIVLGAGSCRHLLRWIVPMYGIAVALLVGGLLVGHQRWLHAALLAAGGALMALTHLVNRHALRHHGCVPLRLFGAA
jgi:hypothetical protein